MTGNEPTIPNLRVYDQDESGAAPNWPLVERRLPPPPPSTGIDFRTMLLGISVGANVVLLIGLVGVLVFAHAGVFAPSSSTPPASASTQNAKSTTQLPSVPSPTTVTDWLQVDPTSVQLGCGDGQQTQSVVLSNRGSQELEWQADIPAGTDQPSIDLSPDHGQLDAGASVTVEIQRQHHSDGQQGLIHIEVAPQAAGSPTSLRYTVEGCD